MANTLEHERMRFSTMNERQLRTRLGRITDRVKLNNFIQVCGEWGHMRLLEEARRRYAALFSNVPPTVQQYREAYVREQQRAATERSEAEARRRREATQAAERAAARKAEEEKARVRTILFGKKGGKE